jgi:hypothetical protein
MLTLLVDAEGVGDLLDRSKLLGNVAKAANNELAALIDAKVEAEAARQQAVAAGQHARDQEAHVRQRAAELEQVRAARAAAKRTLEPKVARLQVREGTLRAASARIVRKIRAEEAAARRRAAAVAAAARRAAAAAARRGRRCWPTTTAASGAGPTPPATSGSPPPPSGCTAWWSAPSTCTPSAAGGRPGSVRGSDHPYGGALDVMVGYPSSEGRALGWRIATWASGNAWALEMKYVIFNGRIWSPGRGWHGYRHPPTLQLQPDPAPRRPRPHLGAPLNHQAAR